MIPTYTLCFITRTDSILLLLRNKEPNKGLWNGVGGKIERGETPLESCLREVKEETGFLLDNVRYCGVLSWLGHEIGDGGVYLFTATTPDGDCSVCSEGILRWHPLEWVFSSTDVVSNIHYFGPSIVNGEKPKLYHFDYRGKEIVGYHVSSLPDEYNI